MTAEKRRGGIAFAGAARRLVMALAVAGLGCRGPRVGEFMANDGSAGADGGAVAITEADYHPAVDLTAEGIVDWAHWGTSGITSFDHKATGGRLIGNAAGAEYPLDTGIAYSWSDGTPTVATTTNTGVYANGGGRSFSLSVVAGTAPRTLRLYIGGNNGADATLTAHLDDGSAPDATLVSAPARDDMTVDILFHSASENRQLRVTWAVTSTDGAISLQSATLF
jgi:hypothetical protein